MSPASSPSPTPAEPAALAGRTVLVTGAASGLGAAVAAGIAAAGGRPLGLDRVPVTGAGVEPGDAEVVDLADGRAAEEAVRRLVARAGGVDGVVTAAGVDVPGTLADIDGATWDRIVAVNLLGTAAVVRAALPSLVARSGRVVTVSSTLGIKAVSDATAYCASKFGVVGFTRALAAELRGSVGVTLLIPGGMHTAFFDDREDRYKPPPDAKLNRPQDTAAAVLFALAQPPGCELRELVVTSAHESSWP